MSQWMRSPVPGDVMCSGLFKCRQAASAFCCSSSVGGTVSPPQHVWSSGFRNFARRRGTHCQHTFVVRRTAPLHLDDYLRLDCFPITSVYSALGVSAIMRYINRRFTYLLTYLHCQGITQFYSSHPAFHPQAE